MNIEVVTISKVVQLDHSLTIAQIKRPGQDLEAIVIGLSFDFWGSAPPSRLFMHTGYHETYGRMAKDLASQHIKPGNRVVIDGPHQSRRDIVAIFNPENELVWPQE